MVYTRVAQKQAAAVDCFMTRRRHLVHPARHRSSPHHSSNTCKDKPGPPHRPTSTHALPASSGTSSSAAGSHAAGSLRRATSSALGLSETCGQAVLQCSASRKGTLGQCTHCSCISRPAPATAAVSWAASSTSSKASQDSAAGAWCRCSNAGRMSFSPLQSTGTREVGKHRWQIAGRL